MITYIIPFLTKRFDKLFSEGGTSQDVEEEVATAVYVTLVYENCPLQMFECPIQCGVVSSYPVIMCYSRNRMKNQILGDPQNLS